MATNPTYWQLVGFLQEWDIHREMCIYILYIYIYLHGSIVSICIDVTVLFS